MERLTMRDVGGRAFWVSPQSPGGGYRLSEDMEDQRRLDSLAAYEETGLSPETVSDLLEIFSYFYRAVEGLDIVDPVHFGAFVDRVKRWQQAEKDGRLVSYMPGDKVYDRFGTPWIVESSEIHLIGTEIKHLYRCGHPGTGDYYAMYEEEIRTKEESEAALKGWANRESLL